MDWEKEEIPNKDTLYRWVKKDQVDGDLVFPQAFKNLGQGMSTDWSEYSTPEKTKNRVAKFGYNPKEYGVISFVAGEVRKIEMQIVEHTPSKSSNNRAHTDVKGEKTTEIRVLFSRIYNWEIKTL